jgi:hypothetical protein
MMLLRMNLGFPDAFVNNLAVAYPGQPDRRYLVVKVVEPGDAWRSKWRSVRTPTKWRVPAPYDSVLKILADTAGIIEPGRLVPPLQLFHRTPDHGRAKAETFPERQRIDANALWYLLESQKTRAGFTEAARIVLSGTTSQRMLAAAVLGRFPERNDAWEELIVALRDSSVVVRQVAGISLDAIPLRPIKWSSGSIASLRALLGGTNVEATEYVQIMLIQSGVSPALAAPLLRGNGDWLLMHLAATNPHSSGVTRGFLTRMNRGVDVGSVEQWASWIARL